MREQVVDRVPPEALEVQTPLMACALRLELGQACIVARLGGLRPGLDEVPDSSDGLGVRCGRPHRGVRQPSDCHRFRSEPVQFNWGRRR
ncbi:MAG: hypothetical protein AAFY46_10030, partial [Planctomycetota bacterium]